MNVTIKAVRATKRLLTGVVAVGFLAGILSLALPASSVAAYTCRVQSAISAGSEAGWVYSNIYYVPGSAVSACTDINVRNIQNQTVPGDHCTTFKVQFFPTSGKPYYNTPKKVCSTGSKGAVVPIATNVLNGTKYRIWYSLEGNFQAHNYEIVD